MALTRGSRPDPGFEAQFPGDCVECDEPYDRGDRIAGSNGDYRHVECPEAHPVRPTKFQGTSLEEMGF